MKAPGKRSVGTFVCVGFLWVAVTAWVAPAWAVIAERCGIASCADCDCYWSSECGSGQKCNYSSGCTHVGKKDGTCSSSSIEAIGDLDQVSESLNAWFEGYAMTARSGRDGLPAPELVEKAVSNGLSDVANGIIRDEVINALDVLLGFDVVIPRGNCLAWDPRCLAQYRIPVDDEGVELLEAGRRGLVEAVLSRNPAAVSRALKDYWSRFTYEPHHTGRCYPHGHVERDVTPLDCQQDELGRIAQLLIAATSQRPEIVLAKPKSH